MNKSVLIFFTFTLLTSLSLFAEEQDQPFDANLPAVINEANAEFVYKFLLAEIAIQRNDLNAGGHLYLDLAKLTKNEQLAQNAARLGSMVRNGRLALDAADVWSKLDPKSPDAQRVLAEMYIRVKVDSIGHTRKVYAMMDWLGSIGGVRDVLMDLFIFFFGGYCSFNA